MRNVRLTVLLTLLCIPAEVSAQGVSDVSDCFRAEWMPGPVVTGLGDELHRWRFTLHNDCNAELYVRVKYAGWNRLAESYRMLTIGWTEQAGDSRTEDILLPRNAPRLPDLFLAWCAFSGTRRARCDGPNDFERNPINWLGSNPR